MRKGLFGYHAETEDIRRSLSGRDCDQCGRSPWKARQALARTVAEARRLNTAACLRCGRRRRQTLRSSAPSGELLRSREFCTRGGIVRSQREIHGSCKPTESIRPNQILAVSLHFPLVEWRTRAAGRGMRHARAVDADGAAACRQARQWLSAVEHHLGDSCLGKICEIADGDEPPTPRGYSAQAWRVGELLRCTVEDAFVEDMEKIE